jgi:putative transposase
LYNQFLEKKIEAYKTKGITLSRYDLQKLPPQLKKEHPEYKEIHSQVLQQVPKRLNDTYNSFFKKEVRIP